MKQEENMLANEHIIDDNTSSPLLNEYIATFLQNAKTANDNEDSRVLFYRGQADKSFLLTPSVFREGFLPKEHNLIHDALLNNPIEFGSTDNSFERLIKMQHYGIPTRLLDVTLNPLVALYFACKGCPNKDGEVIVFYDYMEYPNSFQIKCLVELAEYNMSTERQMLGFLSERNLRDADLGTLTKTTHIPVKAPKNNERIKRQHGAFLLIGVHGEEEGNLYQKAAFDLKPLLVKDFGDSIQRSIVIPKREKDQLLKELDALGINHSVLFPELEHQAAYIRNKYEEG
ncbi:MAG: FRG domain-containing protein [Defluviitaleaceae bacterium]|nr:FRG domain-containing protein [Defluviitaleaceae bacterium]